MYPLYFPHDQQFWYETLRAFGHIAYGTADFGEVATTSERIVAGDGGSWHDAWLSTADRIAEEAQRAQSRGRTVSARDGFLRASNYYRSADFFCHGTRQDSRHDHAYDRQVECFRAAAALFPIPIEPVSIPYEGTTLPGYLYRVDGSGRARPTVVLHNGFDGGAEEMYSFGAAAALERGYTVLTFDGPGHPGPLHHQGLHFRPDWEHVVGPVLDFALALPEVDEGRIALLGNSMGGELAPRAAAFDHRIAALIALDGLYDMGAAARRGATGPEAAEVDRRLRADDDPALDAELATMIAANPVIRWAADQAMWSFGAPDARRGYAAMLDYNVRDGVAEQISCPTLVCDGADDLFFAEQAHQLYDHLTCPRTYLPFGNEEGAGAHCQVGAQRLAMARIYDWLDDTLRVTRAH